MEKCGRCYPEPPEHRSQCLFCHRLLFDHFAVTRQLWYDAGKVLLIHSRCNRAVKPLKSFGRKAKRFRLRRPQSRSYC